VEMFPEDFLRNTARESGLVIRERKIDPVILFWVLTLGFGVRFLSTIRGLKRKYEEKAGVNVLTQDTPTDSECKSRKC